ncbi:MAG: hypothetical protein AAB354_07535 [candidate division KSB1 bacterium]
MLILDENLHDHRLEAAFASWYRGAVTSIIQLRPASIIKDDVVPTLLRTVKHPTFVTINVTDFWKKALPQEDYCIVAIAVPKERAYEAPTLLRRLFRIQDFNTKAKRAGKVIRLNKENIEYYEKGKRIVALPWAEKEFQP